VSLRTFSDARLPAPEAAGNVTPVIILVSNDDGIRAAGIRALEAALTPLGDVWVVAPDREQSAASHSLSLYRPLRVEAVDDRHFAVDGTPTDAVNLAINGIMKQKPDLVVSGINHGGNMGDDITYSGTVSAAMEGTLLGIPSIAVSLVCRERPDFTTAAAFASRLARVVSQRGMPRDTLLNVNVPPLSTEEIRGYLVTRQGKRRYGDAVVEHLDPRGRKYYWIGGDDLGFVPAEGTDCTAVAGGYISITPLHLDLTNYHSIAAVNDLHVDWP
jgi:5'-nucleotidase